MTLQGELQLTTTAPHAEATTDQLSDSEYENCKIESDTLMQCD